MISEMTITPKAENNKARIFTAVLGTLGAFIFGISMFVELYSGLIALAAMLMIVAALTIAVKYLLSEFKYEILNADGEWLFVVGQRSGKRYTTLCRVSLASVRSIEKVSAKADGKRDLEYARYKYLPTFMPESYFVMTVSSRYERAKISLQLTDEMAELLRSYAEEARLLFPDDDE